MIQFHDLGATTPEQTVTWLEHNPDNLRTGYRDEMSATNPLLTIGGPTNQPLRQIGCCRWNRSQINVVPLRTMAQLISTPSSLSQMAVTRL